MSANILSVRGVNDAFSSIKTLVRDCPEEWRRISPRGIETIEWKGLFITEYSHPMERVLFDPLRDANPFFHFFEALWILAGRRDVQYLSQFNSNIANYSDDGSVFHAAYGHRLRHYPFVNSGDDHPGIDQISHAIDMLKNDDSTRQVVLSIWNAYRDLGVHTKDIPCNTTLFLKIRDGKLNLTVACRSNDAVWGAYGANVVQFSTIQQFIAEAVGVGVGTYCQVSDSMHIYVDNDAWKRCRYDNDGVYEDPYVNEEVWPVELMHTPNHKKWLEDLKTFMSKFDMNTPMADSIDPYFSSVAEPLMRAWHCFKNLPRENGDHITEAIKESAWCIAPDWRKACTEWLLRRGAK